MTDADATTAVSGVDSPSTRTADDPVISAHMSRPGRTVLTERDNTDAWIASDLTVSPSQ